MFDGAFEYQVHFLFALEDGAVDVWVVGFFVDFLQDFLVDAHGSWGNGERGLKPGLGVESTLS